MSKRLLTVALTAMGLTALVVGGSASAGSSASAAIASSKLYISSAAQSQGAAGVKIKFTKAQTDNDVARVVVYVPEGYGVVTTGAAGTQLGTAAATVFARDLGAVV